MLHQKNTGLYIVILLVSFFFITTECQVQILSRSMEMGAYIPPNKNSKGSGILGFVIGPILFMLAFVGTWLNEKRAAVNYKRLKMAEKLLDEESKPKQYNLDDLRTELTSHQRLIHVTGVPEIVQAAKDEECHIFPGDGLVLKRKVQVKEMRSYSKRRSGDDQISYKLQWVDQNIEQVENQTNSPAKWFIKSKQFHAHKAKVKNFSLTKSQLKRLDCDTEVIPNPQMIATISNLAKKSLNQPQSIVVNNYIYFPAINGDIQSRGTLRVKFKYCKSTVLSIVSSVDETKNEYEPFKMDLMDNHGVEDSIPCQGNPRCVFCFKIAEMLKPLTQLNLILKGQHSFHEMFNISIKKNARQTYFLRLCFFVLMVLGICAFFLPIVGVLGYIPLVGGFLKGTAGLVVLLGAILVCIPLFSIAMGLAWFRYHPIIGSLFFIFSAVIFILFVVVEKKEQVATV